MTHRRVLLLRACALVCLVGASLVLASVGTGATAANLKILGFGHGDKIYNYDFGSGATQPASGNVDWAVSLLFHNNAYIDKVKGIANSSYWCFCGGHMRFYLNDSGWWEWDEDSGKKTDTPSCLGSTKHFRIYAPPFWDNFYNPAFGFYLFGTTHVDRHELCNESFHDSEGTEDHIGSLFAGKGYSTRHDYGWFYNQQYGSEANHQWENNGWATYVNIP